MTIFFNFALNRIFTSWDNDFIWREFKYHNLDMTMQTQRQINDEFIIFFINNEYKSIQSRSINKLQTLMNIVTKIQQKYSREFFSSHLNLKWLTKTLKYLKQNLYDKYHKKQIKVKIKQKNILSMKTFEFVEQFFLLFTSMSTSMRITICFFKNIVFEIVNNIIDVQIIIFMTIEIVANERIKKRINKKSLELNSWNISFTKFQQLMKKQLKKNK